MENIRLGEEVTALNIVRIELRSDNARLAAEVERLREEGVMVTSSSELEEAEKQIKSLQEQLYKEKEYSEK